MANPKNTNNSDMGMYSPILSSNDDDERRDARFHMLLATTYGLNNSHTKMIHVGLQRTNEGIFKPLVN